MKSMAKKAGAEYHWVRGWIILQIPLGFVLEETFDVMSAAAAWRKAFHWAVEHHLCVAIYREFKALAHDEGYRCVCLEPAARGRNLARDQERERRMG